MDLPNLFSAQKNSDTPEKVIGILLSQTKVQALLLHISSTELTVVSSSDIIEYTDIKNCLLQTDEALQQLGKESESVDSVVFGLNHDWVVDGEVVDQHKPILQQLTTELDLEPVGFIDMAEGLAQHYLAQNSLYSGILVLFSTSALTVSYVSQGQVRGVEQVGRSESVVADLREGLARFSKQVEDEQFYLPAKLVLASFDVTEDELQEMQQDLLDFNWTEHARFLQMPTMQVVTDEQFTAMSAHEAARAAAIATGFYSAATAQPAPSAQSPEMQDTAKEMGFSEVAPASADSANTTTPAGTATGASANTQSTTSPVQQAQSAPAATEETAVSAATAQPTPAENQTDSNVTAVPQKVATSFGVPISSDKIVDSQKTMDQLDQEAKEVHSTTNDPDQNGKKGSFFARLRSKWNEPYKGNRSLKFFILTGFIGGVVVLMLSFIAIVYFTAQVTVMAQPQPLPVSQDVVVILDATASEPDAESLVLPAHSVTTTVSGQDTTAATGVAIVGDEATGEVTIYNKTTASKTFDAGTVLSDGELEFTLDEEVTIASASVTEKDGGEEKEYGRADVAVTATDIGADYNLAQDTELTVANFATETYSATVINDGFSGGASREVQVVSADDRVRLLQDLRSQLIEEANAKLEEEANNGDYVLPSTNVVQESAEFSAEVEDEVTEFALNLEITLEALSYRAEDLTPIAQAILASEIPEGYILSDADPQILSAPSAPEEATDESATVELEANISSQATPILDETELATSIAGLPITESIDNLNDREEISAVAITWHPSFAHIIRKKLPNQEKITVVIE